MGRVRLWDAFCVEMCSAGRLTHLVANASIELERLRSRKRLFPTEEESQLLDHMERYLVNMIDSLRAIQQAREMEEKTQHQYPPS